MQTPIPHLRPWIVAEDIQAVTATLEERSISSYRYHHLLQERLCQLTNSATCLLFATGTLALRSALLLTGLESGSGIAIPSYTCPDLLTATLTAGFRPVVIDCDATGLLDVGKVIEAHRCGEIRAAVAVHQFGLLNLAMQPLTALMPVIEDCCHVPPKAYLRGSRAVFGSFEGTKLLGAGEGGYPLLPEPPARGPLDSWQLGERLSDLVAVLALRQLDRLEENLRRRSALATAYVQHVSPHRVVAGERAAWFRFLVRTDSEQHRQQVLDLAHAQGITVRRPIMPHPLHRLLGLSDQGCPVSTELWERLVSIPLYPDLSLDEQQRILGLLAELGL